MNILLVEDEVRVADFIRRGLAADGWSVDHVSTGEDALEQATSNGYDVILLDLMLPGIQGKDVCRKLRARSTKTPILMLTARGQSRDRDEAERAGVSRFMTKPFSNTEVLTAVRDLVQLAR